MTDDSEQSGVERETITQSTPPSQLPDDPQASFKPPPQEDEHPGLQALSHLSGIQFRMDYTDERADESVDRLSVSYTPDSYVPEDPEHPEPRGEYAFVLGRVIGSGGMGEVREARQISLGRAVAVKRPKVHGPASEKASRDLELFAREAAVTARLEHPHIIPVHDLGLGPDGLPLLAMKLVRGTPWSDLLKRDKELSPRERLTKNIPILIDVSQAVSFAHARGIIHRDLKPSQVMVGRHGEVYLMDWGIAVSFDAGRRATDTGGAETALAATSVEHAPNPAGTSAYMAPEQTEKGTARLGPWTDVWLLGALLYEILTRRPPYPFPRSSDAFMAACRGIVEVPEDRIGRRQTGESSDVPPEISKLCMECLQPEIGKRLPSAEIFLERLQDYQTGATRREESRTLTELAAASLTEIEQKPAIEDTYEDLEVCDRTLSRAIALDPDNVPAAAAKQRALALLAEEAIQGGDLHRARVQAGRLQDESRRSELLTRIAVEVRRAQRVRSQRVAALAMCGVLVIAVAAIALISRAHIVSALHRAEKSEASAIKAREQLRATKDQAVYDLYVSNVRLAQREIDDEHFARAEEALLAAPQEHRGWEWFYLMGAAHPELMTYSGHEGPVQSVAFSPDEQFLASASRDGTARIWQVHSGREVHQLAGHTGPVRRICWSPNGQLLATASADHSVIVWDALQGSRKFALQQHDGAVEDVRFTTSTSEIATLASDAHLRFFNSENGTILRNIDLKSDRAFAFDLSPDGKLAAAGVGPNGAVLVNLETGTTVAALAPDAAECSGIRFSPDGKKVAVAITGSRSHICSVPDGATLLTFSDSDLVQPENARAFGWAADIVWTRDGNALVAGMRARPGSRAFKWSNLDSAAGKFTSVESASFPTGSDVCSIDLARSGNYLAVGSETGSISLYDQTKDQVTTRPVFESDNSIHGLRWSPDGEELVASAFTQRRRYNLQPEHKTVTLDLQLPDRSHCVAYNPEGSRVAFTARRDGFLVQSASTGKEVFRIPLAPGSDDATWVTFSPDSKYMVTVCSSYPQPRNPVVDSWFAADGHHIKRLTSQSDRPNIASFSPDGTQLAIGNVDGRLDCIDPKDGGKLWQTKAIDDRINALQFRRDGHFVAAAGAGGGAAILDAATGKLVTTLSEHGSEFTDVAFSPDGKRLITAAHDAAVGVWDPSTGRALCYLKGHSGRLWQAQWSPDGTRIASSCSGYPGVRLWEPMKLQSQEPITVSNWKIQLREWQMNRFQKLKVDAELEQLPQEYWSLARLAGKNGQASDDNAKPLIGKWCADISSRPEVTPELRNRLSAALSGDTSSTLQQAWSKFSEDLERAFLKGRTRKQCEEFWSARFS